MDFFNCNKTLSQKDFRRFEGVDNSIVSLGSSLVLNDTDAYKILDLCDHLYAMGQSYALSDLDFATKYTINEISFKNPIYCGLVGSISNHLAGTGDGNDDLSSFGRWAIKTLTAHNIMIDLRNLSEKSFMSAIKESLFPVIITSAGLSGLYGKDILKPYQEKIIVDTGGLISLSITKNNLSLSDIALSIADFLEKFGSKSLCLSLDKKKDKQIQKELELLKIYLLSYGVSEEEIEDIFQNNIKNFLEKHHINRFSCTQKQKSSDRCYGRSSWSKNIAGL